MNLVTEESVNLEKLIFDAEHLVERRSQEALPLAERAMGHALRIGEPRFVAYARYILAFYHCLVGNDYDKAIGLCNEVLENLSEKDSGDLSYKMYMVLGNSYHLKGDIFSAQESYLKGLKILEGRKELNQRERGFLASFYYNASILLNMSEIQISTEEYLEKAIEIYKEVDKSFKLSKSYVAYAGILENKKEFEKAIEILFKALEIDEHNNDAYSIALSKANLGVLHLRVHKNDDASKFLKEAWQYFSSSKMQYETAMVKLDLGETLFDSGKQEEGLKEVLEAEEIFRQMDNKRELSRCYEMLADFIAKTGDHKTALDYQKKYTESLKVFFDVEKTNALARAKNEFKTEQKEKEAALLKEKNDEIRGYADKLEESNSALKQFAHVASHDLREPLRMISSYINLLNITLSGKLNGQQEQFFAFVMDGAKRMDYLIIDLLRLAKVDANPKIEKVDLQNIAGEIKMNLDALLKEKNAVIEFSGLPALLADRTQITQLFQNLIANGIKYNESTKPAIQIECVRKESETEISVRDNGIGIPENYREKVFEIFQRVNTPKKYSGSGIGLAICKKIVESMNGKISIGDNPAGGTTFKMVFPVSVLA